MPEDIEIEEYKSFLSGKIPEPLLELAIAEDTAVQVAGICLKNGVEDEEKIEKVAHQIGLVLLGELPPKKFIEVLEQEVALEPVLAERVYLETNRLIFSPVQESLAEVYGEEEPTVPKTEPKEPAYQPEIKPEKPPGKDVYRESTG